MARGSIQRIVGKRGVSYKVVYDLPPDPLTGKRVQRSRTFRTRREAEAFTSKTQHDILDGSHITATKITFSTTCDRYIATIAKRVKPATLLMYEQYARRLTAAMGHVALSDLDPLVIQRVIDDLPATLSPQTVRLYHRFLKQVLAQAVQWRLLSANPCVGIVLPAVVREDEDDLSAWSVAEAARFLVGTREHPHHALFRLALVTAMRRGELLALRWTDIDLTHGIISVRHTLSRTSNTTWAVSRPKTQSSLRRIALDRETIALLMRHENAMQFLYRCVGVDPANAFVFTGTGSDPLHPPAVSAVFQRLVKHLALPPLTFHGLRHTTASLLFAQGESLRTVMDRLGHTTAAMTMRYAHGSPEGDRRAAEGLSAAIRDENVSKTLPAADEGRQGKQDAG